MRELGASTWGFWVWRLCSKALEAGKRNNSLVQRKRFTNYSQPLHSSHVKVEYVGSR